MAKTNVGDLGLRDKKALKISVFFTLWGLTSVQSKYRYTFPLRLFIQCMRWSHFPLRRCPPENNSMKNDTSRRLISKVFFIFLSLLKCWPHMYIRVERLHLHWPWQNEVALHTHFWPRPGSSDWNSFIWSFPKILQMQYTSYYVFFEIMYWMFGCATCKVLYEQVRLHGCFLWAVH